MNGYEIYYDQSSEKWRYKDNNKPAEFTNERPCVKCGKRSTPEGHDACISNLGSVTNACCGHGVEEGYIQFDDGTIITGSFEIERNIEYEKLQTEYQIIDENNQLINPVRCKECKYRYSNWGCGHDQWDAEGCYHSTKDDDYCSYGERKPVNTK